MSRSRLGGVAVLALALLITACTASGDGPDEGTQAAQKGGVLRLGAVKDSRVGLDPQAQEDLFPDDLYACCLLRSLVQITKVTATGPAFVGDIAERFEISDSGLEYRFTLRPDARFGPPLKRPITADDVVATFERALNRKTAAFDADHYTGIVGAKRYFDGDANTISGIEVEDPRHLTIRLERQDPLFLSHLATSPTASPLPREVLKAQPKEVGRYLVASGPYMIEGSEDLDLTVPRTEQQPIAGYKVGQSLVLVRNPEWKRASDLVRGKGAYVDRIEVTIGGSAQDYTLKIQRGDLDIMVDGTHPAQALRQYSRDPELKQKLHVWPFASTVYSTMTLAAPPFDDVHVRRAANWVVNRAALMRIRGGRINGTPAYHLVPPGVLGDEVEGTAPYRTADDTGSLERAKAEMRKSKYDADGDGICDRSACAKIAAVGPATSPGSEMAQQIVADLKRVGIDLDVQLTDDQFKLLDDPGNRIALNTSAAWGSEPFDAAQMAGPLFSSRFIGPKACCNEVLMGATPKQLEQWGFPVREVPSVQDEIDKCARLPLGSERVSCWTRFDRKITEEIVPWIFLLNETKVRIVSSRLARVPYSSAWQAIRYDQVTLNKS